MQQNSELLNETKNTNKPAFVQTDVLRTHTGVVKWFKFKARNETAVNTNQTIDSMRSTLHNLIRNNRNNRTQKISLGITEHFSKRKEVLNDKNLIDPISGVIHRKGAISIPTNERVFDDKYHRSDILKLYRQSIIRNLLDKLTKSSIQNREDNMARLEGVSNHKLEFINNIYIKFREINPKKLYRNKYKNLWTYSKKIIK